MSKITFPKIKRNEQLFFLSYGIYLFFSVLMHSFYYRYFADYYKAIVAVCIVLLLIREVHTGKLSKWAFRGAIILYVAALLIIFRGSGNLQTSFACVFIFAFSARNIDFNKICKFTKTESMALLLFIMLSAVTGIIPNYLFSTATRNRYYLGFRYALNAPSLLLNIILITLAYKREKIKTIEILLFGVFAFVLFKLTNSRLTFGLSIIGLFLGLINKIRGDNFNEMRKIPCLLIPSFLVSCIVSFAITILYNPGINWMRELNIILGQRLRWGQVSLATYGISLFGRSDIEWIGAGLNMYGEASQDTYFYVDNLYIQVLQRYGIIFLTVFLILTTALMIRCYSKKERYLVIILAIIAMHGLIDDIILYLHFNTLWLLFGSAIFGSIKTRRIEIITLRRKKNHRVLSKIT